MFTLFCSINAGKRNHWLGPTASSPSDLIAKSFFPSPSSGIFKNNCTCIKCLASWQIVWQSQTKRPVSFSVMANFLKTAGNQLPWISFWASEIASVDGNLRLISRYGSQLSLMKVTCVGVCKLKIGASEKKTPLIYLEICTLPREGVKLAAQFPVCRTWPEKQQHLCTSFVHTFANFLFQIFYCKYEMCRSQFACHLLKPQKEASGKIESVVWIVWKLQNCKDESQW